MARSSWNKLSTYRTNVYVQADGTREVFYHSTCIVTARPDSITLRTGGHWSVTTKRKMNQASNQFGLGYSVYQKNFGWFVVTPAGETLPFNEREITFARASRKAEFAPGEAEAIVAALDPQIKRVAAQVWAKHPNNPNRAA